LNGSQGEIYREARSYLAAQAKNFAYLDSREREDAIREVIENPNCYENNNMNQVKSWLETLRFDLQKQIDAERDAGLVIMNPEKATQFENK
jgi:hypothetical protein